LLRRRNKEDMAVQAVPRVRGGLPELRCPRFVKRRTECQSDIAVGRPFSKEDHITSLERPNIFLVSIRRRPRQETGVCFPRGGRLSEAVSAKGGRYRVIGYRTLNGLRKVSLADGGVCAAHKDRHRGIHRYLRARHRCNCQ